MSRFWIAAAVSSALLLPAAAEAAGEGYPNSRLLMEPQQLHKQLDEKGLVVLDVRSAEDYANGHVPGALRVDHDTWKSAFGDGKDAAAWSKRIGSLGIDGKSTVVVYDNNYAKNAARVWWILRYWGLDDVRLLNGQWHGWTAAKLPVSSEPAPQPAAVTFKAQPRHARLADKKKVLNLLEKEDEQVVDARSFREYCGLEPLSNLLGGAIPGAKHLEWKDLLEEETQRFKSAEDLSLLLTKAGINPKLPITTHCQSGGRASVMVFGLELMGAKNVRNYYRGWSEWGNDKNSPIEKPKDAGNEKPGE